MSPRRNEEELLHLLLDRGEGRDAERTAELLEAQEDPEARAVLAAHRELLGRARATLDRRDEWSAGREKALVRRILAETTRQDLRLRGDLRLVARFVRQRLGSSPTLRALAATVIMGFFVTSLFAYLAIREHRGPQPINVRFEQRDHDADRTDAIGDEGTPEEPVVAEIGELTDAERRTWRIENALRRDRYLLSTWTVPDPQPRLEGESSPILRLLDARLALLGEGTFDEVFAAESTLESAAGLDRVLLAELLLDRNVLGGERAATLPRALHRISTDVAGATATEEVLVLGRRVLDRARAYGLWEDEGTGDGRHAHPLGPTWGEALAAALPAELREHPLATVWLR